VDPLLDCKEEGSATSDVEREPSYPLHAAVTGMQLRRYRSRAYDGHAHGSAPTRNQTMTRPHEKASMIDDMGIFRTTLGISALATPKNRRELFDVMVDTGSEYTWIPSAVLVDLGITPVRIDRFETADGRLLEREVGFALLYAGGRSGPSVVVFAREGDLVLLGAHGLEGLNLRVDLARRELIPAGPLPAAFAA
jgi:predicted aspartyl protease